MSWRGSPGDGADANLRAIDAIGVLASGMCLFVWPRAVTASLSTVYVVFNARAILAFLRRFLSALCELPKLIGEAGADEQGGVGTACRDRLLAVHDARGVPTLTSHEIQLSVCVVDLDRIDTTLADVGGLGAVVDELFDVVVTPLANPEAFAGASRLTRPPRGVLLYGEPGTGKTLLARAIARESGAALVNVRVSNLIDKYFGESNKLVAAVFSLARKLAPAIIVFDEVDGFLRTRSADASDHAAGVKAEFLAVLDGLVRAEPGEPPVVALACTNRPHDLDPAVLRRLPLQFHVGLPDVVARRQILGTLLREEAVDGVDLEDVADRTPWFSGSDLEELCRRAASRQLRAVARRLRTGGRAEGDAGTTQWTLRQDHFDEALLSMLAARAEARRYGELRRGGGD